MSNAGALNYKLGGDASELQKAFETGLRYAGDSVNKIKAAFSVRGIFDGLVGGLKDALGGGNLGEIFSKAVRGALGKEVLQQNFEGLLGGNVEDAEKMIGQLKRYAKEAQISQDELFSAARRLIGEGANAPRAVQDLKMLGEVARATGAPIGELASIWGKMFDKGGVDARMLHGLREAGISMTALAKAAGMTPAQFEEMGNAGKLSFDIIDAAMRKLTTGTGHLAGQVARYRGTALGMFEAIRDGIGRIPQAFFSGVIANGMGDAKTGMAAIRDMVDGWVSSAKRFGEVLAAALKVAKQLWDKGEFASTLKDALIAAFGAGVDYLVKGMVGAAYAFGAVLKQVIDWAKAEYIKVMYPQLGTLVPQKEISASSVGATASAGFSEGYASTEGPGFGRAADTRFHERVDKMMFEARGGAAGAITRMMEPFQNIISKAFPRAGLEAFRDLPNNATAIHGGGGTTFAAPDALAKIGLFVGAGGPQGEAHAKATAKNTAKAVVVLEKIEESIRDQDFGGGKFR